MGYTTRPGTQIQDFWPDDTDTVMHIQCDSMPPTLAELMDKINEKWPGSSMENITIEARKIHTYCLGYDLYDPMDYTNFIIITKHEGA